MVSRRGVLRLGGASLSVGLAGSSALGLSSDVPGDTSEYELSFEEVAADVGITMEAEDPVIGVTNSGVFVNDFNDDGFPDILTTGLERPRLFENTGGEFEHADALPEDVPTDVRTVLFFDHDNDGREDLLLVPRSGEVAFLENRGGTFREKEVGVEVSVKAGVGCAAADYTGNGYPDVLVLQNDDLEAGLPSSEAGNAGPNLLFRNEGGTFTLAGDAGIDRNQFSFAASFVDFTGNGWPDIHVANDFGYDTLYVNNADGTFTSRTIPETNRHGMCSVVADVTGDGKLDVFVTNIRVPDPSKINFAKKVDNQGNNLLVNQGEGRFVDRAEEYGVRTGYWGWAAALADLTNDTHYDLVQTTQTLNLEPEGNDRRRSDYTQVWRGTADGFESVHGADVGFEETDGRGLARIDFDRDGRLDLALGNTTGTFKLYRNTSRAGNWIKFDLRGDGTHTVLGSKVFVTVGGETSYQEAAANADYLSQSSRVLHFGLGTSDAVDAVRVRWPDGQETVREDVGANQRVTIEK